MERKSLNQDDVTQERASTPADRSENERSLALDQHPLALDPDAALDPDTAREEAVGDDENLPV